MSDDDDFLAWVRSALYDAGSPCTTATPPRRAVRNEPVNVLGAWRNAHGRQEVDRV